MALSIVFQESGAGTRTLTVAGEVDFSTSPLLAAAIRNSLDDASIRSLQVDLEGLAFCDATGIGVLLSAHAEADIAGATYDIVNAHGVVLRALVPFVPWMLDPPEIQRARSEVRAPD